MRSPLVVLTKADLVPDAATLGHLVQDVEKTAPGVPGVRSLPAPGRVLTYSRRCCRAARPSSSDSPGAGKSTFANALIGEDVMDVRAARDVDGKGRHTTTTHNLLALPGGSPHRHTPDCAGVGLWDAETGVGQVFSEIEGLAADCASTTAHTKRSPAARCSPPSTPASFADPVLASYRKLLRENQRIVAKTDARVRAEIRRDWKRKERGEGGDGRRTGSLALSPRGTASRGCAQAPGCVLRLQAWWGLVAQFLAP